MPSTRRGIAFTFVLACAGLLAFFGVAAASAQTPNAIAQSFTTTETNLVAGAFMSLKQGSNNTVELANTNNADRLVGIVGSKTLLQLGDTKSGSVQVVTSGVTDGLVSDANGPVNAGDKLTASPIAGIGMKATSSLQVVGTAQANLAISSAQTRTVTKQDGTQTTVHIAQIPVQVNVTYYASPGAAQTFLPPFLQDFANSVGGKQVSPARVIIATLILLLAFVSIAVLLYSTVRSSIISIGRNPLSERAVRKSIVQIGLTILGILLLTLITIYLILST